MKLKTKQRGILLLLGVFLAVILVYNTNSTDKTFPNPDMSFGRPGLWAVRIKKIVPFARIRAVRTYFYCRGLEST